MSGSKSEKKDTELEWDDSPYRSAVMIGHKFDYIKKDKKYAQQDVDLCIICKIVNNDPNTPRYEIYRNDLGIIFLNLYPYQVGHVLISPLRHVMAYEEYTKEEIFSINELVQKSLVMLKSFGNTESFNVGWNQGEWSGGSIKHHHIHIVPRYRTDLNFLEIIARTKPYLQSLEETMNRLHKYIPYLSGQLEIEELDLS